MKGKEAEKMVMSAYESAGYETYRPPKAKYREQDIFGLYDVAAFGHGQLILCQVKANQTRGLKDWIAKARTHQETLRDTQTEYIVVYEDQGMKLYRPDPNGLGSDYEVAFDGREIDETPAQALIDTMQIDPLPDQQ